MKWKLAVFLILTVFMLNSCGGGKLAIKKAEAIPPDPSAGSSLTLRVIIDGPLDAVSKVVGTVREYTDFMVELRDNGEQGDEKAGDNIWTRQITVPWEADPGTYHLDISVYDKNGKEIVTKGLEAQTTG